MSADRCAGSYVPVLLLDLLQNPLYAKLDQLFAQLAVLCQLGVAEHDRLEIRGLDLSRLSPDALLCVDSSL